MKPPSRLLKTIRRLPAAALCAALALPAGPTWSQPVGLPSMGAAGDEALTPAVERELGEAIMAQGRQDPTYLDDSELRQYLTGLVRKLAQYAPGPVPKLEAFAVSDPEINAFAMPGGFIGVNTGLLVSSENESELAAVLAHETGHIVQRHIARGMTQQGTSGAIALASLAGALLAALAGQGNLAMGVAAFGQAAAIDRQLGFSRQAESEADHVGLEMMTKAGFDPNGMATMFGRLAVSSRLNEGQGGGVWVSTHPLTTDRMSDVQNRIRDIGPVKYQDSSDFWFLRAKARVLQARDANDVRVMRQQLQDEANSQTGIRRAAARYGLALYWLRHDDPKQAQAMLDAAGEGGLAVPELAKLSMDIAQARKDAAGAARLGKDATRRWPDYRALGLAYATALLDSGQIDTAQAWLRAHVQTWAGDEPVLYQMLAFSEDRNNRRVQARLDMARYYELTRAYVAAEAQLQQARKLSTDFYEQSQIDVRIREVRQKLAEERALLKEFK